MWISPGRLGGFREFGPFAVTAGALVIYGWISQWRRSRQIRRYAGDRGFSYIGDWLPRHFPIEETFVARASSTGNAVIGDRNGKALFFCDCTFGQRHKTALTVVAIEGAREYFAYVARFDVSLVAEQAGDWALIYRPRELLPIEVIDALLAEH